MVTLSGDRRIKVQIWDTGTTLPHLSRPRTIQSHHISVSHPTISHYRKAQGALVVYDMTKEPTFKSVRRWIEGIREHAVENVVIVIVGNKSDLKADQVVTTAEGKRLAKELGCFFEETSAITGDNIDSTFKNMLEGMFALRS